MPILLTFYVRAGKENQAKSVTFLIFLKLR